MPRTTRHLVVNADDFGISRGVNRGIVEAHRAGLVTSASLMANLPSAEDALTRAAICPDLGLGLHLTLTAGRPLSPPERVPTLVDADGRFLVLGTLLARLSLGQVHGDDLRRELTAQVEWALRRGIRPDHLDSHHHVHVHPRVAPIVIALAREHRHRLDSLPGRGWPVAVGPGAPAEGCRPDRGDLDVRAGHPGAGQAGRPAHDPPLSRHRPGHGIRRGGLLAALERLPPGLTELMTHPGHPDEELARLTVFAEGRDRELGALTSPAVREAVRRRRIRLTSFAWLRRDGHGRRGRILSA